MTAYCTHAGSCGPSAHTAEAFSDAAQSDCGVAASSIPSRRRWRVLAGVRTRDTLSAAGIRGGGRKVVGGCCCYGNSQADPKPRLPAPVFVGIVGRDTRGGVS